LHLVSTSPYTPGFADVVESPWWLVRSGKLKEAEHSLRRLSRKGDTADPAKTVAMMVRTNQHELENQPGVSFFDCFKGSDLRRTEIAVVGWAVQVLSGSSFGNQGTYFFQQGQ
jgi:SP family general alpha glucoside:H+ symporter-like MFS transporter